LLFLKVQNNSLDRSTLSKEDANLLANYEKQHTKEMTSSGTSGSLGQQNAHHKRMLTRSESKLQMNGKQSPQDSGEQAILSKLNSKKKLRKSKKH
jgi:hypothetical protein